ncbi:MAG: hypothetical protein JSR73_05950 [Proteobacteria bacterium]|nr:hypothetical protein [Pseudomonadota bacterium]
MTSAAACRTAVVAWLGSALVAMPAAVAQNVTPATSADHAIVTRTRAAIDEIHRFELVAAAIAKRCQDPVTGAYQDWREEFDVDLKRVQALDRALQKRAPATPPDITADARLAPFAEAEGQVLYSRCLRWSTLLIQHESPLRAALLAEFAKVHDDEAEFRRIVADDARWHAAEAANSPR